MAGEFIRVFKEERKRQKNVLPVRQCERDHPHEAHTWTYIEPQIDLEYICQGRDS